MDSLIRLRKSAHSIILRWFLQTAKSVRRLLPILPPPPPPFPLVHSQDTISLSALFILFYDLSLAHASIIGTKSDQRRFLDNYLHTLCPLYSPGYYVHAQRLRSTTQLTLIAINIVTE
jgi:hypothetical protein